MAKRRAASKKQRTPKTKTSAPGAQAALASLGHNKGPVERTAEEIQALFLSHRGPWNAIQAQLKAVRKRLADLKSEIKADGFRVRQFEIADQLGDVKGEARVTAQVDDVLRVARWIGHPMGAQLDLFNEPDRTPITDRAYEEGKRASMTGDARKPTLYAPDTEAYRSWMQGFDDHQRELVGGFKRPKAATSEELH